MIIPFIQGFGTGGGLIVAIGAQNAFVLSQGIRQNHHLIIALICIVCDAVFIAAGVAGFGGTVSRNPALSQWVSWGGAGFLILYGLRSFCSAFGGGNLEVQEPMEKTLVSAIVTTLAVTLLNPHFYLDTVILMGSVSSRFPGPNRFYFWTGAVCASTLWFAGLSLGGRILAPLFTRQVSWRILDTVVGVTMWAIAVSLILM